MDKLTASLEDYLEAIYNLEINNQVVKPVDISKTFNISRASVTEALKKLAQKGYVVYDKNDPLSLTELGFQTAKSIITKHQILQDFFEKNLGLSKEEASFNACKIEHVITENAFQKISQFVKI